MKWPLPQDFNEAVQNPAVSFADPDLAGGEVAVGPHGLPLPHSGNFADVYQVRGADGRNWAVKCFTRPVFGLNVRYARLAEELERANLRFTVGFTFLADGIRVRGEWRPVIKMEWVEGRPLNQVVADHLDNPKVLRALAGLWSKMCGRLREAGIAHGDIQHGNVLLVPGSRAGHYGLTLVDYDGMYVPSLAQTPSGEAGHPNFQHPERVATRAYSPDLDRFPHLVVVTALKALELLGPDLWNKYDNGDNLLFTERDYRGPSTSAVMRELWGSGFPPLQSLVGRLALACTRPLSQTPWLDEIAPDGEPLPLDADEADEAAVLLEAQGQWLPVMPKYETPTPASQPAATEAADPDGWEPAEPEYEEPEPQYEAPAAVAEPEYRDYEEPEPEYERDRERPPSRSSRRPGRRETRSRPGRRRSRSNLLGGILAASGLLVAILCGIAIFIIVSRDAGTTEPDGGGIAQGPPRPPNGGFPVPPNGGVPLPPNGGVPVPPNGGVPVPPNGGLRGPLRPSPPAYPGVASDRPELELTPRWSVATTGQGDGPLLVDSATGTVFHGTSFRPSFLALDLQTGEPRGGFEGMDGSRVVAIYPLDGGRVATHTRDEFELRVWNAKSGESGGRIPVKAPTVAANSVRDLAVYISPNGRFLLSARNANHFPNYPEMPFELVDQATGRSILAANWKGGTVRFTADSSRVFIATYDGLFQWLNLPGGQSGGGWDHRVKFGIGWHYAGGMSSDGSVFGYTGSGPPTDKNRSSFDRSICLLDNRGTILRQFPKENYDDSTPAEVSGDGRLVVVRQSNRAGGRLVSIVVLDIYETATGSLVGRVSYRSTNTPRFALSADGRALAVHDTASRGIYLFDVQKAGAPAGTSPQPAASGTFRIISRNSSMMLGLDNGAVAEGTKVVTTRFEGDDLGLQWKAIPAGGDWYYLENQKTGTVMTVAGKGKDDGAEIIVAKKETPPSDFQLWKTSPDANQSGAFNFYSRASGKVFAVDAGSLEAGARILLWGDNPGRSKRFGILPVK